MILQLYQVSRNNFLTLTFVAVADTDFQMDFYIQVFIFFVFPAYDGKWS